MVKPQADFHFQSEVSDHLFSVESRIIFSSRSKRLRSSALSAARCFQFRRQFLVRLRVDDYFVHEWDDRLRPRRTQTNEDDQIQQKPTARHDNFPSACPIHDLRGVI
jgi:hypothetical protein